MSAADVAKAIAVTAELTGASLSGAAVAVMTQDLMASYPEDQVIRALIRCRKELTRPLSAGAVFERLAEDDGRPSGDEAWAIALQASDEAETVVWNQEIQQAMAVCRPILDAGDKIGARMAFREAYERSVRVNREAGLKPKWSASLGWDQERRRSALESAERMGLLPAPVVSALLPAPSSGVISDALFGNGKAPVDDENAARWIKKIKENMRQADRQRKARRDEEARSQREAFAERKKLSAETVERELRRRREID